MQHFSVRRQSKTTKCYPAQQHLTPKIQENLLQGSSKNSLKWKLNRSWTLPSHTAAPHSNTLLTHKCWQILETKQTNSNKQQNLWRLFVSLKAPTVRGRIPREAEEILMGSSSTKLSLLQAKKSQLPHVFIRNARKKIKQRSSIASSLLVRGWVVSSGQSRWGKN